MRSIWVKQVSLIPYPYCRDQFSYFSLQTITWLLLVNSLTTFGGLKGLLKQMSVHDESTMFDVNAQNVICAENLISLQKHIILDRFSCSQCGLSTSES